MTLTSDGGMSTETSVQPGNFSAVILGSCFVMFIPFGRSVQPPVSQVFVMGRAWIPHEGFTQRFAALGIFVVLTTLRQGHTSARFSAQVPS